MLNVSKYRFIAIALAAVFCLFNIGLPIVIAACPMMNSHSGHLACCAEKSSTSGVRFESYKNTSCCTTTFAAKRNTTEYLKEKNESSVLKYVSTLVLPLRIVDLTSCVVLPSVSPSPPRTTEDIPVFNSSLLI
jgi:hypothetical protein